LYNNRKKVTIKVDYFEERAKRKQTKDKVQEMKLHKSKEMRETKEKLRMAEENMSIFKSLVV
jgi:hypothetical protein